MSDKPPDVEGWKHALAIEAFGGVVEGQGRKGGSGTY